jgi:hypothetical protein
VPDQKEPDQKSTVTVRNVAELHPLARTLIGKLPSQSGITAHVCGDCSLQGAFAAAV